MKLISLTRGLKATVDDSDFEYLNRFRWLAVKGKHTYYAIRSIGKTRRLMHREILGLTDPKVNGEHKNGNGLDNRRGNLRIATDQQNKQAFRTMGPWKTSKFRGVSWQLKRYNWRTQIQVDGKQTHVGTFSSERRAARAYDVAARKYFGEFAHLNFPKQLTQMKKSKKENHNGHGGNRPGSGRPPLPPSKRRKNVTVKLLTKTAKSFTKLAKQAKVSKGGVIEYMVESKQAEKFRRLLVKRKA